MRGFKYLENQIFHTHIKAFSVLFLESKREKYRQAARSTVRRPQPLARVPVEALVPEGSCHRGDQEPRPGPPLPSLQGTCPLPASTDAFQASPAGCLVGRQAWPGQAWCAAPQGR